jgi:hypothetical protein
MFRLSKRLAVALILCSIMASNVYAATSDTFTITVTCRFIDIVLKMRDGTTDYTTWAIGAKNEGAEATMAQADGIKVVNTSNVATNVSAWVSANSGSWSNAASAGADHYKLEMKAFTSDQATPDLSSGTTVITGTSTPGQTVSGSLGASTDDWWYCKFTVPSSTTSGGSQTITVTVLASPAS